MACPVDNRINEAALVLVGFSHQNKLSKKGEEKLMPSKAATLKPSSQKRKVATTAKAPSLAQMRLMQQVERYCPSSAEPQQQQTKRRRITKRSVRFECPPISSPITNNHHSAPVRTQVYRYDKVDDANKQHVWWTPDELRHIHKRERSMVGILSHCCGFYVEQLSRLTEISFDASSCHDLSQEPSFVWVANSPGRGLESQVTALLINSTESTKTIIRSVLEAQRQLKENYKKEESGLSDGSSPSTFTHIHDILKAHYEQLSAPRMRYAQFLAAGDALVAGFKEEDDHNALVATTAVDLPHLQDHSSIGTSSSVSLSSVSL